MLETIKNNVLIKTLVVVILGVLGFGLAFNIMFGRNTGMMGEGMNSGYALENTLAYILLVLVKLLLIAIVLAAITAVHKLSRKYLFEGGDNKLFETVKNDPIVKMVSIITASILIIVLIALLFGNIFGGYGMMTNYSYSMGAAGGLGLASMLTFLAKLLLAVSAVGLVAAVIVYMIQNTTNFSANRIFNGTSKAASKVTCSQCGYKGSEEFEFCPSCGIKTKSECSKCGMAVKPGWKCCPNCGEEIVVFDQSEAVLVKDTFDVEQESQVDEADIEPVIKEDKNEDLDSNDGTGAHEKLNDSAPEETVERTNHAKNRKKQNKR